MRGEKRAQTGFVNSPRSLTTNNHNNHHTTAIHHTSNRKDLIATNLTESGNREIDDGNNNSCSSSSSTDDIVDSNQTTSDTKYLLKDLINNQRIKEESDNLQALIKGKIEHETRNIGDIFDKTVNGIVELKEDLLRLNDNKEAEFYANNITGLRNRKEENVSSDKFLKKEIDAINAAVQQANVLPAVLSNGHAK